MPLTYIMWRKLYVFFCFLSAFAAPPFLNVFYMNVTYESINIYVPELSLNKNIPNKMYK